MAEHKCILVVDDEPLVAQLCKHVLTVEGHEVLIARTGEAALEQLEQVNCDLVLVDLRLPGINGWDTFRAARRSFPDLSAILMTGYGGKETVIAALKAGFNDFLDKPFTADQLVLVVQQVIERRREKIAHAQATKLLELERDALAGIVAANSFDDVLQAVLTAARGIPETLATALLSESAGGYDAIEPQWNTPLPTEQMPAVGTGAQTIVGTALWPLWSEAGVTHVAMERAVCGNHSLVLCLAAGSAPALSKGTVALLKRLTQVLEKVAQRLG